MSKKRPATTISYAQVGYACDLEKDYAYVGYGSVDLAETEAQQLIETVAACHGRLAPGLLIGVLAAPETNVGIVKDILDALGRHYIVSVHDKRPAIAAAVGRLFFETMFDPDMRDLKAMEKAATRRFVERMENFVDGFAPAVEMVEGLLDAPDAEALAPFLEDDGFTYWDPLLEGLPELVAENGFKITANINRHRPLTGLNSLRSPRQDLTAFHAHNNAWGRLHRQIKVTCASSDLLRDLGGVPYEPSCHSVPYVREMRGAWKAWRLNGSVGSGTCEESVALQLARFVASVAALYASLRSKGYYEPWRWPLEDHCLNGARVFPILKDEWKGDIEVRATLQSERDQTWTAACDGDSPAGTELLLASRICGYEPRHCRDRLLFKMLAREVPTASVLALDIETLNVDLASNLYAPGQEPGSRTLLYRMDSTDEIDLWAIISLAEELEGPLFAAVEGGKRRRLTALEVNGLAYERLHEFDLLPKAVPAVTDAEDVYG